MTSMNDKDKLQNFARLVLNDAQAQQSTRVKSLRAKKADLIAQAQEKFYKQAHETIAEHESRFRREANERISRHRLETKRTLALKREKITADVSKAVREKLVAFTKTEAYYPWLVSAAKRAAEACGEGKVVLYICENDRSYARQLAVDTDCSVVVLDDLTVIGGVRAVNTDRQTGCNLMLAALLHTKMQDFLKISGLTLE